MISIMVAVVVAMFIIIAIYEADERRHAHYERAVYLQQLKAQQQHAESEWQRKNYEFRTRGYYND